MKTFLTRTKCRKMKKNENEKKKIYIKRKSILNEYNILLLAL